MIYNRPSHILWITGEEMMRNSQGPDENLIKQTDSRATNSVGNPKVNEDKKYQKYQK